MLCSLPTKLVIITPLPSSLYLSIYTLHHGNTIKLGEHMNM